MLSLNRGRKQNKQVRTVIENNNKNKQKRENAEDSSDIKKNNYNKNSAIK